MTDNVDNAQCFWEHNCHFDCEMCEDRYCELAYEMEMEKIIEDNRERFRAEFWEYVSEN
mgnify:CR=1 FL=1